MAVSKRARFEVLRRDGFECQYCHAADAPLTVDHVLPSALGGSDRPENLVAACRDCNSGKSSAAPGADLAAPASEDALLHADRIKAAYAVLRESCARGERYVDRFATEFPGRAVPQEWKGCLLRWQELGVPIEVVIHAGHVALSYAAKAKPNARDAWFRHLSELVWLKVGVVSTQAMEKASLDGAWMTEEQLSAALRVQFCCGEDFGRREATGRYRDHPGIIDADIMSAAVDGLSCEYAAAHGRWSERRSDLRGPVSMPADRLVEGAR